MIVNIIEKYMLWVVLVVSPDVQNHKLQGIYRKFKYVGTKTKILKNTEDSA